MAELRKSYRPKLKPCPCCGGKAIYIDGTTRDIFPKVYKTIKVGCFCGIFTRETIWEDDSDVQEVADMWNRRCDNGKKNMFAYGLWNKLYRWLL